METIYDIIYSGIGDPQRAIRENPQAVHERRGMLSETALHLAAKQCDCTNTELLISNGADVNSRDNLGLTPLHRATEAQKVHFRPELIRILIKHGADVNARSNAGEYPIHGAARAGSEEAVDILIAAGARPNVQDNDGVNPSQAAYDAAQCALADILKRKGCGRYSSRR